MKGMWARAYAPERSERAPRKAPRVKPGGLGFAPLAAGLVPGHTPLSPTDIFAPASTPAQSIFELSVFVWATAAAIFLVVFCLLALRLGAFPEADRTTTGASRRRCTGARRSSSPGPSSPS